LAGVGLDHLALNCKEELENGEDQVSKDKLILILRDRFHIEVTVADADEVFAKFDVDGDGTVDLYEFVRAFECKANDVRE
jgi:Ca2+-binding EF-hand superfamily protein